jgi:hypothetical protein
MLAPTRLSKPIQTYWGRSPFNYTLLPNEPRIANPAHAQALSDRFLTPALAEIEALLLFVRALVNPVLSAHQPLKNGKPYPLGQCLEISKAVEQRLKTLRMSDLPDASTNTKAAAIHTGFRALQAYKHHGGTIRLVWGDLRGQYFQNAFLVGIYYMDVSNDTVFVTKPKVEILPLAQANFRRIEDYEHFIRVAKNYWGATFHPNNVLPELAPFCPLVAVFPDGSVELMDVSGYMFMLNLRSRFKLAQRVLEGRALDADVFSRLASALHGMKGLTLPVNPDAGRIAALKMCANLRQPSGKAIIQRCNASLYRVHEVNAHLSTLRLRTLTTQTHSTNMNASTQPTPAMPTFLHIGCGPKSKDQTTKGFNTPEWTEIRLDIDASVQPDVIGTMTDMQAVASESVDAIFSSHNIEHLYPHEVSVALKEFLRVLKPDGFFVVTCPDLQSVCALVAEDKLTDAAYTSPAGPIAPIDILYGHRPALAQRNLYMAHRCGFTKTVLDGTLRANGFQTVAAMARGRAPFFDLWAVASKSARTQQEMMELAKAHLPV